MMIFSTYDYSIQNMDIINNLHIYSRYTISNYSAKNEYLHNKNYLLNGVVPTLAFLTQLKLFFAYFTTKYRVFSASKLSLN